MTKSQKSKLTRAILLFSICSVFVFSNSRPKTDQLHDKHEYSFKKLLLIPWSYFRESNPQVKVVESSEGRKVSVIGGGNYYWPEEEFKKKIKSATQLTKNCVMNSSKDSNYFKERVEQLFTGFINQNDLYDFAFLSELDYDQVKNRARQNEELVALAKKYDADGILYLITIHRGGVKRFSEAGYTGYYAGILDLNGERVYEVKPKFSKWFIINDEICPEFISDYEKEIGDFSKKVFDKITKKPL